MIDPADLVARLRLATRKEQGTWALHEPTLEDRERSCVLDAIETNWVSSVGSYVDRFEELLADVTGAAFAVATVNGTAALHTALRLVEVGQDDEVLVPAVTFVGTANAVAYCGAIVHVCDVLQDGLGLDPERLQAYLLEIGEVRHGSCWNRRTGRRIAAIVPVDVLGHPARVDDLTDLSEQWNIPLVRDSAEALGSRYCGRPLGGQSRLSILSFNGNKIVTTGGGGAILTNDAQMAAEAKHLTTTARRVRDGYMSHDRVGYNYRLPNLNAALGIGQLERLPAIVAAKRRLAARYVEAFEGFRGARIMPEPVGAESNYWLNALVLDRADLRALHATLVATAEAGFMTRPLWDLMHRLPMYRDCPRMTLNVAEDMAARVVCLPSSPGLAALNAA